MPHQACCVTVTVHDFLVIVTVKIWEKLTFNLVNWVFFYLYERMVRLLAVILVVVHISDFKQLFANEAKCAAKQFSIKFDIDQYLACSLHVHMMATSSKVLIRQPLYYS